MSVICAIFDLETGLLVGFVRGLLKPPCPCFYSTISGSHFPVATQQLKY